MNKHALWEKEAIQIANYYTKKISSKGYTFEALASREKKYTNMFFDELFKDIKIEKNSSFLDIGSGLGLFVDYLKERKISPSYYLGVELIKEFVDYSNTNYPAFSFVHANFLSNTFDTDKKYDYTFALGVLVSRVSFYEDYLLEFIKKMIKFSNRYVLFNLITEIDLNTNNYENKDNVGGITSIEKAKLIAILDSIPNISYEIIEKKIFDDATDAFIKIKIN